MRHVRMLFIAALCGLFTSGSAGAITLEDAIKMYVSNQYQTIGDSVAVEIVSSALKGAIVNPGDLSIKPMTDREPRGLFSFWCIRTSDGAIAERGQVTVRIRTFADALVSASNLPLRTQVTATDVLLKRIETTSLNEQPLTSTDRLEGFRLKRNLPAGAVLTAEALEATPVIQSGQEVVISFEDGPISVSTAGQALQNGGVGDLIRIRNKATGKQLMASVVDSRRVRVN